MRKLTRNFYLEEFEVSETAARMGRSFVVPEDLVPNVVRLCETVLQPLRDSLRRPIFILSGYRPPWLNAAVGGSRTSAHKDARAADIVVPGLHPREVCYRIVDLGIEFDQLILEFDRWTHVGIAPVGADWRGQLLTASKVDGRTQYRRGLVA